MSKGGFFGLLAVLIGIGLVANVALPLVLKKESTVTLKRCGTCV